VKNLFDSISLTVLMAVGTYIIVIIGAIIFQTLPPATTTLELPPMEDSPNRNWGVVWDEEDLYCLALNIYFEARGEPVAGKYAVGDVVMYRTQNANYPNTICGVIKDGVHYAWNPSTPIPNRCAFSWYCNQQSDDPVDGDAFEEALFISYDILTNPMYQSAVKPALFYHADYVGPYWAASQTFVKQIGHHLFYF